MTIDQTKTVDLESDCVFYECEIYQAQGFLSVSLGVDLAEAMVRLRTYASNSGQPLGALARRVVVGAIEIQ